MEATNVLSDQFLTTGILDMEINAPKDEEGVIYGYANRYGNLDRNGNIIQPGALSGAKNKHMPLLWNHDQGDVLGSAWVTEDDKGMRYKAKFAIDSESDAIRDRAKAIYSLVKDGHVRGNSIGFVPTKFDFRKKKINGEDIIYRQIEKLDLAEVTICPVPANPKAQPNQLSLSQNDIQGLFQPLKDEIQQLHRELEELKTGSNRQSLRPDIDAIVRRRLRAF